MSNKNGPSIYIPSDKHIYDALRHKKVKHAEALKFLRNRGIIVSSKVDKMDLSKKISCLTFDYHDFCFLTKLLENPNRKEKTTKTTVKVATDNDELVKVCQNITNGSGADGESYNIVKNNDSTVLVVTYTEVDFTKTELRQRSVKNCEINLQPSEDGVTIRMPATKKGKELARKIKSELDKAKGKELEEDFVSLENIANPEARSMFFDELIKSVPGYKLDDVSSINVHHEIEDLTGDPEDDVESESSVYAGYISKAILSGGSVLESAEFKQLHSNNFFISRIVWTAEDELPNGDIVELEAQFGAPASCTDFKYLVRAIRSYNEKKASHNVTKRSPSRTEITQFNIGLEKASKIALDKVKEEYK